MYKVHYLPLALDDLKNIMRYIAYKLEVPRAAERLLSKINKEVLKIANNPYRCRLYISPGNSNMNTGYCISVIIHFFM
jgi:plasmid stabilization system protein ParE